MNPWKRLFSRRAGPRAGPLRLAFLFQYFEPGGLERMVLTLATGLLERNTVVWAVAYQKDGPLRSIFETAGVRTHFFAEGEGRHPTFPLRLARWLHQQDIELLHSHHLGPYLYGGLASGLAGIPLVHTEHSRELYAPLRYRLIGRSMDLLSSLVVVTPELARWRREQFGQSARVIPNGVEIPPLPDAAARHQARLALGLPEEALAIGCIARLSAEKNHQALLSAMERLIRELPAARLILAGDGPERTRIEEQIQKLRLSGHVHLLGYRADIEKLLPGLDLVALSSRREGLPLALLEAMARGIPAVATAVGGIPDLLKDGGGVLVPPEDSAALGGALLELGRDAGARARLGQQARALIEQKYSRGQMIAGYRELYLGLTGRTG